MAKVDVWMPIYLGDFLSDTLHLSTEQLGAYFLLLAHGWRSEGKIPADEAIQARLVRMSIEEWRNNRPVICGFYQQHGDYWVQGRQAEELKKAESRRESAKQNGIRGGRPNKNPQETARLSVGYENNNPQKSSLPSPSPKEEEKNTEPAASAAEPAGSASPDLDPGERAELREAVRELFRLDEVTQRDDTRLSSLVRDFAAKGAARAELMVRFARYQREWPEVECSPEAMLKHWGRFAPPPPKPPARETEPERIIREANLHWELRWAAMPEEEQRRLLAPLSSLALETP